MDLAHVAAAGGSFIVMDFTGKIRSSSGSWPEGSLQVVPRLARTVLTEAGLLTSSFREAGRRLERITIKGGGRDVLVVALDASCIYVVKRTDADAAGSIGLGSGGGSLLSESSASSGSS